MPRYLWIAAFLGHRKAKATLVDWIDSYMVFVFKYTVVVSYINPLCDSRESGATDPDAGTPVCKMHDETSETASV